MKKLALIVTVLFLSVNRASAAPFSDNWEFSGSLALTWRGLGPAFHAAEVEVENSLFLPGTYLSVDGPVLSGIPFRLEMTTDVQGQPRISQILAAHKSWRHFNFAMGKFLIPYGAYNRRRYRPDQYLTITHPLFYADPRNLDAVIRLNLPHPLFSAGYTDIGAEISFFPDAESIWAPYQAQFYAVNGLAESREQGRPFPSSQVLVIAPLSPNGVDMDWNHQNTDFRDNNDTKSVGGRLEFRLGDFSAPLALPAIRSLDVGFSAMGGRYDIDDTLKYGIYGADLFLQWGALSFNSEFNYSSLDFRSPLITTIIASTGTTLVSADLPADKDYVRGYSFQAAMPLPLPEFLWGLGGKLTGVLGYDYMQRYGPELTLRNGSVLVNGQEFFQINVFTGKGRVHRRIKKHTAALNYRIRDNFSMKWELTSWELEGHLDLYQWAVSSVFNF